MEIVAKVDDPTDWISSMVVITKRSGKVRLCIDPNPLNNTLKRNHYRLPSVEDVLPLLSDAKFFTVLDARNGFWHVQLDTDNSYLTTFSTPWSRYRWLRMPFGITSAPEEFQRRMDIALEGLDATKAITDDILVFSTGSTLVQSLNTPFFPSHIGAEPGWSKRESRITCMRMLRIPPFFPPKSGEKPYLEACFRFGL